MCWLPTDSLPRSAGYDPIIGLMNIIHGITIPIGPMSLLVAHVAPSVAPPACFGHCMTALGSDSILLYGGDEINLSDTWIFSTTQHTWMQLTVDTSPGPRWNAACATTSNSTAFLFGGEDGSGPGGLGTTNDIWSFNLEAGRGSMLLRREPRFFFSTPRAYLSMTAIGWDWLVVSASAGGVSNFHSVAGDPAFYFLDLNTLTWYSRTTPGPIVPTSKFAINTGAPTMSANNSVTPVSTVAASSSGTGAASSSGTISITPIIGTAVASFGFAICLAVVGAYLWHCSKKPTEHAYPPLDPVPGPRNTESTASTAVVVVHPDPPGYISGVLPPAAALPGSSAIVHQ
ncbi:hypothetical protein BDK51DRAFT_46056 [Blyttiomyces helicus]|uniref:Kelch repeat protein n=1 Tax=Blyttiomyces helicus TaxID=388810 RepID=A0A4P9WGN8_9FUNG|nr:hypothetical protein BDK51DRAFT_46056 [Blyttiomyces helicus]|eukprot:RKO91085.1 hypothetical protein BDK51DRAFT_46056 [Blyttiomyces helicus]